MIVIGCGNFIQIKSVHYSLLIALVIANQIIKFKTEMHGSASLFTKSDRNITNINVLNFFTTCFS